MTLPLHDIACGQVLLRVQLSHRGCEGLLVLKGTRLSMRFFLLH